MSESEKSPKSKKCLIFLAFFMFIIICLLVIALVLVTLIMDKRLKQAENKNTCQPLSASQPLSESDDPAIFSSLTTKEHKTVVDYLFKQKELNIVSAENAASRLSYIYLIEHITPTKDSALEYLDNDGSKPERWAKAVVFHGDLKPPKVIEYKVGPLPSPSSHEIIGDPIDYKYRPCTNVYWADVDAFLGKLEKNISQLLEESYGAKINDCDPCLEWYDSAISSHIYNETRAVAITFYHMIEFEGLHNVDLQLVLSIDKNYVGNVELIEIWYANQVYATSQELMDDYVSNKPGFKKSKILGTFNDSEPIFSNLRLRKGVKKVKSPPVTYEPEGKRYTVSDNLVKYMDWDFKYSFTTTKGPALFDVKYKNERIAYEISLQELAVIYSAHNPTFRFANYYDTCEFMGAEAKGLVPGVDCPDHAMFLPTVHLVEASNEPEIFDRSVCIFEMNTGVPLHRHRGPDFYGGLPNNIIVFRTLLTIYNYDYILDFRFFQNGAIDVVAHSTGYATSTIYNESEKPFGWKMRENFFSPIHHHLFHYKVDLDIHGRSNRFETLEFGTMSRINSISPRANELYHQMNFTRTLVQNENDARYKYDFNKPTNLIIHNDKQKMYTNLPKAYRLHAAGISKMLIPERESAEDSGSWARQQVAVTKYKEAETKSSTIYSTWDGANPRVRFDDFIDNESIVDEDLVAWVTLGVHHIPHTEDLPITPTTGMGLSFMLTPYNYFPECPSMDSPDGVYLNSGDKPKGSAKQAGVSDNEQSCPSNFKAFVDSFSENESYN